MGPALAVVVAEEGSLVEVCGLTLLERVLRALARVGLTRVVVLSSRDDVLDRARRPHWTRTGLAVTTTRREAAGEATVDEVAAAAGGEGSLFVPGEVLVDGRLLATLLGSPGAAALVDSAPPPAQEALLRPARLTSRGRLCGPARLDADALAALAASGSALAGALAGALDASRIAAVDVAAVPAYVPPMRRTVRPLWFPAPAPAHRRRAERLLLDTAQKGVLDLPAIVHGPIETFLVSHLCRTRITPNQLTVVAAATAWGATALLATGHLGWGLAVAVAVGVLDGLDGKQARVKLETSAVGELEHVSDFAFELSWWTALAWHFQRTGAIPGAFGFLLALYLAEGLDGLVKLGTKRRLGRLIDDATPFLRRVRLVGGRRNVYAWIMATGALLGTPAAAYRLLPFWQGATAAVHLAWAFGQLLRARRAPALT